MGFVMKQILHVVTLEQATSFSSKVEPPHSLMAQDLGIHGDLPRCRRTILPQLKMYLRQGDQTFDMKIGHFPEISTGTKEVNISQHH